MVVIFLIVVLFFFVMMFDVSFDGNSLLIAANISSRGIVNITAALP